MRCAAADSRVVTSPSELIVDDDVGGHDVCRGGEAVGQHLRGRAGCHCRDALVVGVEHGDAVGRKCLDQFTFRTRDGLDAAEEFEVHALDPGDDADGRVGDRTQQLDMPDPARTHLDDRGLGVVGGVEQGER